MKKLLLTTAIFIALTSTEAVYAVTPKPPILKSPDNLEKISKTKLSFEWFAPSNAKDAVVQNYRFIITTNSAFSDYDKNKKICIKNTCFTKLVTGTKLPLSAELKTFLKPGKQYFWQVQAISKGGLSAFNGNKNSFNLVDVALKISAASSNPESAPAGSQFTFNATLTTTLPAGYSVKIDVGDGVFKPMKAADKTGLNFTYAAVMDTPDLYPFDVYLFDKNNAKIETDGGSISGSYEVLESDAEILPVEPVVEPVTVIPSIETKTDTTPVVKPIIIPSVSNPLATPSATVQGNSVTFSATLSANLPDGYNVKVNYGNGLIAMSGSGKNYSVSQTPLTLGLQTFTVGIYDNLDLLKSNAPTGTFEIMKPNTAPTLTFSSGATTATLGSAYTVQVLANDSDNNLNVVKMDWGDGATESQAATNGATLTFSHTYTSEKSFTWKAIAYDSSNASSSAVSKKVTVSKPVVTTSGTSTSSTNKLNDTGITTCSDASNNGLACPLSDFPNQDAQSGRDVINNDDADGHAGFSFTKISDTGANLSASATSWNCVKDNVTGLTWEVKTTDGGLHDWNHTYTWYEPDNTKNGGAVGTQKGGSCSGSQCDTNAYVKAVNAVGYCGYKDWRLPTVEELLSIVSLDRYNPAIDTNYFPNTQSNWFWSSSPVADSSSYAWIVYFSGGSSSNGSKYYGNHVRLVR